MMIILADNIARADNVDNDINDENGDNCETAGNGDIAEKDDNDDFRIPKLDTDNNINKAKPTKGAKVKEDQSINFYLGQSKTMNHLDAKKELQIKNTRHAIVYSYECLSLISLSILILAL